MEVMFIGGVFSHNKQKEVIENSKSTVNYAANEFQIKLIDGFLKNGIIPKVLSAPFVGAYPKRYKRFYFKKFEDDDYNYVSFLNLWGIRNFSRANALKSKVKSFAITNGNKKVIIVYSPHTPFLEAACYAKRLNPSIHICLVVPDLPQYMNLQSGKKRIYNFIKSFDIKRFNKLNFNVNSYVLLTEQMKEMLKVGEKPYIVVEGMVAHEEIEFMECEVKRNKDRKRIVYTGTLNEKFGILHLVEAFKLIENDDVELLICGEGESKEKIKIEATKDKRIRYLGQVDSKKSKEIQRQATILVNPRMNNEEYTKYSFPSKNMEYLLTGNPVIAYKLCGIPDEYKRYLIIPKDESVDELKNKICEVLQWPNEEIDKRKDETLKFLLENKTNSNMVKKIKIMLEDVL